MQYVKNKDLLEELIIYREQFKKYEKSNGEWPGVSERLGHMILLIATNLAKKGSFSGYTYKEDMISEAVLTVLKYIKNFNPEKSNNPFAYITQICRNAFINYINRQKRHSIIKDVCFNNQQNIQEEAYLPHGIDYRIFITSTGDHLK